MHDTSFVSLGRHLRRSIETVKNGHIKEFRPEIWSGDPLCRTEVQHFALAPAVALPKSAVCDQEPVNARLLVHMQVGSVIHRNTLD